MPRLLSPVASIIILLLFHRKRKGLKRDFLLISSASANPIDVAGKASVVYEFCRDVLFERRYGAGKTSENFAIFSDERFRQNHICQPHCGEYGFGKGVDVNNVVVGGIFEKRFGELCVKAFTRRTA